MLTRIQTKPNKETFLIGGLLSFGSIIATLALNHYLKVNIFASTAAQAFSVFVGSYGYALCAIILGTVAYSANSPFRCIRANALALGNQIAATALAAAFVSSLLIYNHFEIIWPSPIPISQSLFMLIAMITWVCGLLSTEKLYAFLYSAVLIAGYIITTQIYQHVIDEWADIGLTIASIFLMSAFSFKSRGVASEAL